MDRTGAGMGGAPLRARDSEVQGRPSQTIRQKSAWIACTTEAWTLGSDRSPLTPSTLSNAKHGTPYLAKAFDKVAVPAKSSAPLGVTLWEAAAPPLASHGAAPRVRPFRCSPARTEGAAGAWPR